MNATFTNKETSFTQTPIPYPTLFISTHPYSAFYHPDSTGERTQAVPEPVRVDGQVEFAVEKIIQERRRYGRLEYLVH
jgi:hypothetical protein